MKMIHTKMNQNALIITFTEKDPRRGDLSSPSHMRKVYPQHVQESNKSAGSSPLFSTPQLARR